MTAPDAKPGTTQQLNAALAGRYLVEQEIGHGGMATVYRARDLKHNRTVALKVLRQDLGAVLGPERFLAEIEVTANLQHPNLLPLFDSGEVHVAAANAGGEPQSLLFYVMPYIEGQTLRQRLEREGQLPVDEAVRITTSIAAALDYAHRHGVVHRDLKPENILLHEGQPLVMDFGIALAVSNAGGERLTQMGLSLGSPQYMSPEQATGDRELDARSDIYSLAVVLYEMLAGAPPHAGNSVQAVIAKVIMDRPASVRATRETVPPHVDAAVSTALAKLPADRYATALDFARALTGEHALVLRQATAALVPRSAFGATLAHPAVRVVVKSSAWLVLLGGAAAAGAAAALAWFAVPAPPSATFTVVLPASVAMPGSGRALAVSPDGSQLATVGLEQGKPSRLFVRPMAGVEFGPLHGTDSAFSPSYSPDGKALLFVAAGWLMKVPADGGTALKLADSTEGQHSWGDDNRIVFTRHGALWAAPAGGGSPRLLARPDSAHGVKRLGWPEVLPGSRYALITIERVPGVAPDSNHIGVVSLADGAVRDLGLVGTGARFAAPDQVVYATADGSLWAVPFSVRKHALSGTKVLLAGDVHVDASGAADVTVSSAGTLVYGEKAGVTPRAGSRSAALAIVDPKGATKLMSNQTGSFDSPRVSPAGDRIALAAREAVTRSDVWTFEIARNQLAPMTRDAVSDDPEWLDEKRIAFRQTQAFVSNWLVQPWDLSTPPVPFFSPSNVFFGLSLGPAAGYLAASRIRIRGSGNLRTDVSIARMGQTGEFTELVSTDATEVTPRVSPNGKWVAYSSNESGAFQLYVLPLPAGGARVPVSIEQGYEPVWSRDGHTLYYVSGGHLLAARIDESRGFLPTRTDTMFSFTERGFSSHPPPIRAVSHGFYDVFPNGDFVVLTRAKADSSRSNIIAMMHFQQLLKAATAESAKP